MTEHTAVLKAESGSSKTGKYILQLTAKAGHYYYELEKVVIFPHKIIFGIAGMELSEFLIDSLLLLVTLIQKISDICNIHVVSPEVNQENVKVVDTHTLHFDSSFLSMYLCSHIQTKTVTDVSGAMGAIHVRHSGLNPAEGQGMLFSCLKPELLEFITNALVHFSKNEHTCAFADTSYITTTVL